MCWVFVEVPDREKLVCTADLGGGQRLPLGVRWAYRCEVWRPKIMEEPGWRCRVLTWERDLGTLDACTAIRAGIWAGTSGSTPAMGRPSWKQRLIQGGHAALGLDEDALLRASPLAAQDLRPLPMPGGEDGRAGREAPRASEGLRTGE